MTVDVENGVGAVASKAGEQSQKSGATQPGRGTPKSPPDSVFSGLPKEAVRKFMLNTFFWSVIALGTGLYGKAAVLDAIGGPSRVDVHVRLIGYAAPGEVIELSPSERQGQLSVDNEVWYRNIEFERLRGKTVEVRVVRGLIRNTVVQVPIGDRPIVDIQRETKR